MSATQIASNLSSIQSIQPLSQRSKLKFSFNDQNPNKSVELINEMIKKNELKIKTSNKRLFSDISMQNTIPVNIKNPINNIANTNKDENNKDETDSKLKKLNTLKTTSNLSNTSFLNKIVGFKPNQLPTTNLTFSGAKSPSLITMIVSNTNSASTTNSNTNTIGSSFARKLKDIQSERNVSK